MSITFVITAGGFLMCIEIIKTSKSTRTVYWEVKGVKEIKNELYFF